MIFPQELERFQDFLKANLAIAEQCQKLLWGRIVEERTPDLVLLPVRLQRAIAYLEIELKFHNSLLGIKTEAESKADRCRAILRDRGTGLPQKDFPAELRFALSSMFYQGSLKRTGVERHYRYWLPEHLEAIAPEERARLDSIEETKAGQIRDILRRAGHGMMQREFPDELKTYLTSMARAGLLTRTGSNRHYRYWLPEQLEAITKEEMPAGFEAALAEVAA